MDLTPGAGFRHAAQMHRWCDTLTEVVLYILIVFAPWAFGATQPWSIRIVNGLGYVLGGLWLLKLGIRRWGGYQPVRWDRASVPSDEGMSAPEEIVPSQENSSGLPAAEGAEATSSVAGAMGRWLVRAAAVLTVFVLAFCLMSALNPRAVYIPRMHVLLNQPCILWLPHSYDSPSTWLVFWQYLSLAGVFWALRDWLLIKTRREAVMALGTRGWSGEGPRESEPLLKEGMLSSCGVRTVYLPERLRRLLWVLCLNGAVLAIESVVQRLDGTNRLLWLVQPRINQESILQFGPFAYRSNGAQYLNLLWPICLGFWFVQRQNELASVVASRRIGSTAHVVLLPCVVIMSAAPVISSSRGGAFVALASWGVALVVLWFASWRSSIAIRLSFAAMFCVTVGLALFLGGAGLRERLKDLSVDKMSDRVPVYQNAMEMAAEHPWYGTGPGTFCTLYQYYMGKATDLWVVQAHNDWLETRITFGWVGTIPLGLFLLGVFGRGLLPGGVPVPWFFVSMIYLGLAGCLFHAWFDFPLQILSILSLFVMLCSIVFVLRPRQF